MKILTILGCRPQFIKAALVSAELKTRGHEEIVIHTGQHFDPNMSDIFFNELGLEKPTINLDINSGSELSNLSQMIAKLEQYILPIAKHIDCAIVYGDTTSTLAGAIVCSKLRIKIAHVEAGLRSYNRNMPEEQNRIMVDSICDVLFTPTDTAYLELYKTDIEADLYNVGDVMYDMVMKYKDKVKENAYGEYYLATIHRAQNTNTESLNVIFSALNKLDRKVIIPTHPRIAEYVNEKFDTFSNVLFTPAVGYTDMISLEKHAVKIITDSGGVQKEAFMLGVPCITIRPDTEWVETLSAGANRLCRVDEEDILDKVLPNSNSFECTCYGFGDAHKKIIDRLEQ